MIKMINECGKYYDVYTITGVAINVDTGARVVRVWAYPVAQACWGADKPATIYLPTAEARREYLRNHDYCNRLPRCKIYSDNIDYNYM